MTYLSLYLSLSLSIYIYIYIDIDIHIFTYAHIIYPQVCVWRRSPPGATPGPARTPLLWDLRAESQAIYNSIIYTYMQLLYIIIYDMYMYIYIYTYYILYNINIVHDIILWRMAVRPQRCTQPRLNSHQTPGAGT